MQDMAGGEQPRMQRDRLEVAAERLADRHDGGQPSRLPQLGSRPGEPGGQGAAVEHHIDHGRTGPCRVQGGEHGGQCGMQVGDHDRHLEQVISVAQRLMMRRALLVRAEHGRLQRRVAGLDQVTRARRVVRQPVRNRDHERITAGAKPELERRGVEQHAVTWLRPAGQFGIRQSTGRRAAGLLDQHVELRRTRPLTRHRGNDAAPPSDHLGRVASDTGKGARCRGGRPSGC